LRIVKPQRASAAPGAQPCRDCGCRNRICGHAHIGGAIGAGFMTGIGVADSGTDHRLLIPVDIERLISSLEIGLTEPAAA
jgi:hypothetical protein